MFCMKCLKEKVDYQIKIPMLGYGSDFDSFSTQIDLCEDCYNETNKEWWELEIIPLEEKYQFEEIPDPFMKYKYEDEIIAYVKTMPLEGQEKFYNSYSNEYHMDIKDWVAYHKGELSHERCKDYGMYSPQEISAYEDRFPNCSKVEIQIHSDGSKGSRCHQGARGDENGKCGLNMWNNCYLCDSFSEREGDIEVVDTQAEFYKRETERCNDMIKYASGRLEKIKNRELDEYE